MLIRNGLRTPDDFLVRLAIPETPLSALLPPSHLIEHGDYEELHETIKRHLTPVVLRPPLHGDPKLEAILGKA